MYTNAAVACTKLVCALLPMCQLTAVSFQTGTHGACSGVTSTGAKSNLLISFDDYDFVSGRHWLRYTPARASFRTYLEHVELL